MQLGEKKIDFNKQKEKSILLCLSNLISFVSFKQFSFEETSSGTLGRLKSTSKKLVLVKTIKNEVWNIPRV